MGSILVTEILKMSKHSDWKNIRHFTIEDLINKSIPFLTVFI